jgi:two-component system sensor histidine kinase RcsD
MQIKNVKLTSAALTRSLLVIILLLLLSLWLLGSHAVNAYVIEKKHSMASITTALQKRIENYRFVADQLYALSLTTKVNTGTISGTGPKETRLRPDVFYVEKHHKKTDALIFGPHDPASLASAVNMSAYLDILWGGENNVYSLYYLNGADNSLTLISTQPVRDIATRFEDSYISALAKSRRTEMLQQANILDQRESFSPLRRFRFQNDYYFTQRITFNQPGHLATVIALDLPINDLIPLNMARANFSLYTIEETDQDDNDTANQSGQADQNAPAAITAQLRGPTLEISSHVADAPLSLVYHVPLTSLIIDMLRNNFWPIAINLLLITLSLFGIYLVRQHFLLPKENMALALKNRQILSDEVIANLPLGLLVYDFGTNHLVASNKVADHLLPHLSLQKIANLAESHQGIIQATVNNEVYEIRMYKSQLSPETYLFQLLDHDKEVLVNKKLQQAQQELTKNHQARRAILKNFQQELSQPLMEITTLTDHILLAATEDERQRLLLALQDEANQLVALFDNLRLLTLLELEEWQPEQQDFTLSAVIDELLTERMPALRRKGLGLFNHNRLPYNEHYLGDAVVVKKIISLILDYSIISTQHGKITLIFDRDPSRPDSISLQLNDTGNGIDNQELANLQQPFISPAQQDHYQRGTGLAWFLCQQMAKKMGGNLDIQSKIGIGTRYRLRLVLPRIEKNEPSDQEKILAGTVAMLDIANEEIQGIASEMLQQWGVECLHPDEHSLVQEHDLLLTDDPARLEGYAVLLQGNENEVAFLSPIHLRVNYNLSTPLLDAMLQLMELRLAQADNDNLPSEEIESASVWEDQVPLLAGDYIPLFVETVPDDIKRLYTEAENGDLTALAQTAHRLKGVFAMLNLNPGKQLCETLEQHIKQAIIENDNSKIGNDIRHIDVFVIQLLQHAR